MTQNYTVTPVNVYDYSIVLGFTSCSLDNFLTEGNNIAKLLERQRKYLFDDKIKINELNNKLYQVNREFYKPGCSYLCFGEFDFLTITPIEGYGMGSRVFNSMEYALQKHKENEKSYPFHTQVSLNALPFNNSLDVLDISSVNNLLREANKEYPFLSIIKIKLNDSLQFTHGNDFVNDTISRIKKGLNSIDDSKFILLKSYSWNELTLVFFSKCFSILDKNVLKDFRSYLYKEQPSIVKTSTTLGFNYQMFIDCSNEFKKSILKANVSTSWRVCPARIAEAAEILNSSWEEQSDGDDEIITNLCSKKRYWVTRGKGDIISSFMNISIFQFIKFYREIINRNNEGVFLHGYTSLNVENEINIIGYDKTYWGDRYLKKEKEALSFMPKELDILGFNK